VFESVFKQPNFKEIAPDIIQVDFLEPDFCHYVIAACEDLGTWAPAKNDKHYSTQDIHFQKEMLELYEMFSDHFHDFIVPVAQRVWGVDHFELTDMFAIKYSMEGQKKLKLHHDDSYITGSIKLNDSYEGADLYFPRQDFSNKEVSLGSIILFPGKITHPHLCTPLTQGTKYSMTLWTKDAV
jgi:hypothetical protein